MKYARISENIIQEIFIPQKGFTIEESFHSEVVKLFEKIPDEVELGWVKNADNTFSAPVYIEVTSSENI